MWWHVPFLFLIAVVAIAEIWGSVVLGKMVHKARNINFVLGKGYSDKEVRRSRVPYVTRAYDPVILGEMNRVSAGSLRVRLMASPGKSEQQLADDSLSGTITNLIVDTYVGRISETIKDAATGDVVLDVVDMKIETNATPPTLFLTSLQNASSFVGTVNGAVSTTLFGF